MTDILDTDTLSEISSLEIVGSNGEKVRFGSLFEDSKTVVVFIRHFVCGRCQEYVRELAGVSSDALKEAGTSIVIIGCGKPGAIPFYQKETGFQGRIYANPSLELFKALKFGSGTTGAPAGEEKRSYVKMGWTMAAITSIWRGPMKNPSLAFEAGPFTQLGGDFILGPGNQCTFGSRMRHTGDHVEVADLMRAAGVAYP